MADDIYVKQFKDYLVKKKLKDKFDKADGKGKSKIANKYVKEEIPFAEKPAVVKSLNDEYENEGPFLNNKKLKEGNMGRICSPNLIYQPEEIVIHLLKKLQSGENESLKIVRSDIADELGLSPQSLDKYLQKLKSSEGINLFNHHIKIDKLRHGKNTYDDTIHPIFLTLNLTEVYFLTVFLPCFLKGDMQNIAIDIAEDVFSQLSDDYAKKKMAGLRAKMGYPIPQSVSEAQSKGTRGYRKEKKDFLHYFHKSGDPCSIEFKDGMKVSGIITSWKGNQFQMTEDGTDRIITFNEDDVNEVKRKLNSKKN